MHDFLNFTIKCKISYVSNTKATVCVFQRWFPPQYLLSFYRRVDLFKQNFDELPQQQLIYKYQLK